MEMAVSESVTHRANRSFCLSLLMPVLCGRNANADDASDNIPQSLIHQAEMPSSGRLAGGDFVVPTVDDGTVLAASTS